MNIKEMEIKSLRSRKRAEGDKEMMPGVLYSDFWIIMEKKSTYWSHRKVQSQMACIGKRRRR